MPKIEIYNYICKICKKRHDDNAVYKHDKTINSKELMTCPICGCVGMIEYITGRHKKTKIHSLAEKANKTEIVTKNGLRKSLTIYFD